MNYGRVDFKDKPVIFSCIVKAGMERIQAYSEAMRIKRQHGNKKQWKGFSYNKVTGFCQFR